jgi:hypothetical protein
MLVAPHALSVSQPLTKAGMFFPGCFSAASSISTQGDKNGKSLVDVTSVLRQAYPFDFNTNKLFKVWKMRLLSVFIQGLASG